MQNPSESPDLRPPRRGGDEPDDPNPDPGDPNPDPGDPNPDPGDPNPDPGDPNPGHAVLKHLKAGKVYSGAPDTGNISEAIEAAILSAKESILADFVRWELVSIQGESGGFLDKSSVTVFIRATGPNS
ncbi:MAG: hypothetical protein K9L79_15230 [Methylobacter tundripaludum]|nr:hypothetical protein [Methylobacter tundripaludum]